MFRSLVCLSLMIMLPGMAHAYLDPGTGSAIIQGLIAAVAMASVTLKVYWHRVLSFFQRSSDDALDSTAESGAPEPQAASSAQPSEDTAP